MKPTALRPAAVSIAATLAIPGTAWAHPGHEATGFATGFAHAFTGADHLLATLAVGLWAAQIGARAALAVPLAFVAAMLAGALLGLSFGAALVPAGVESAVAASVLALGLLVAARARLGAVPGALLVAAFAVFHGLAHAAELGGAGPAVHIGGLALATALLHGLGLALGLTLRDSHGRAAAAGVPIALAGSAWLLQALVG